MKVLLVGPYPPPYGGISVHVWSADALLKQTGMQSRVLNVEPNAPSSSAYIKISGATDLLKELFRHVYDGWTLSVHTNGHNWKSWLITLICGMAGQFGEGATLTLHSGMLPDYLRGRNWRKTFARMACVMYYQITCVNHEIAAALTSLGIPIRQLEIKPAFLPVPAMPVSIPEEFERWMHDHSPFISFTTSFRPEYGFEPLMQAVSVLHQRYPELGCFVMGNGEGRAEAENFIDRYGFRKTVFLSGDLAHELCLAVISRSAVFVRPTFRDGDSISVREAMSLGIPVVASNVGTRPEGTLLFEAGDVNGLVAQVERALSHRERARKPPCLTNSKNFAQ